MRKKRTTPSHGEPDTHADLTVEPAFVLLFSIHRRSILKIGRIASGIATGYYHHRTGPGAVLGWSIGAGRVSGLILVLPLRGTAE